MRYDNFNYHKTIFLTKELSHFHVVLGPKVRSNVVSIVQFFVLIPNLASDLPYVAYFGGKLTSKFGLSALFKRLAFRL